MAWQEEFFEKKKKNGGVHPCIYIRDIGNYYQEKFLDFLL